MRKIALSLAVIAASGAYAWSEAGRLAAEDLPKIGGQALVLPAISGESGPVVPVIAPVAAPLPCPATDVGIVVATAQQSTAPMPRPARTPAPAPARVTLAAAQQGQYVDGVYKGPAVDAHYGLVQVQATVQGGQLVNVEVLQYPSHRRTSRRINGSALPKLVKEAIRVQSGQVDAISGATLTSAAYRRSLSIALAKANA